MTRRCTAPAKDDTHKSERIWLKHEPYEGRSEVRCQKHPVGLWGGFACLRVFVVPCYPASIRFVMEKYDPLDDLPMQFRRHPASPTPSHFSVVTNTPSPEPNSRNQQVMSPSPQAELRMPTTSQASTQQMTAEAAATATQALQMHVESEAGSMTLRSLTSFTLQPEHLQELQESILLDQGASQDVRSAIVELSARIQHRTMIQGVGATTQGLQEGCIALETHVAQLASAVQEQQRFMEQLREQTLDSSETARGSVASGGYSYT